MFIKFIKKGIQYNIYMALDKRFRYIDFLLDNIRSLLQFSGTKKDWCEKIGEGNYNSSVLKDFVEEMVGKSVFVFDKDDLINNKEYTFYRISANARRMLFKIIEESEEFKYFDEKYTILG